MYINMYIYIINGNRQRRGGVYINTFFVYMKLTCIYQNIDTYTYVLISKYILESYFIHEIVFTASTNKCDRSTNRSFIFLFNMVCLSCYQIYLVIIVITFINTYTHIYVFMYIGM